MISVILQACIQGNYYLFTEAITELIFNFMKTFLVEPILRIGSLNTSFEYLTKFEVQLFHTLILLMNYVNDITLLDDTAWKMFKYWFFFGPYYPIIALNTGHKKLHIWILFTQCEGHVFWPSVSCKCAGTFRTGGLFYH